MRRSLPPPPSRPKKKPTLPLGRNGENIALAYLRKKKFRIIESGFRFQRGEIDLVAWDRETLVFVEVKARTGNSYGRPEESVTPAKQDQIRKLARGYLALRRLDGVPCRFDVVAVRLRGDGPPRVDHFKDAF